MDASSRPEHRDEHPTRRQFLERVALSAAGAAALSAGGAAAGAGEAAASTALPELRLGPHSLSRLILGGNPIYGHSHFNHLYSRHLVEYHTPERVVELLRAATSAGITAWQNSYDPRTLDDVERCRDAGVRFHWLLLGKPDWDSRPAIIEEVAKRKPIGIAPHGALAERLHRSGKLGVLKDLLARIRETGVLVGLSAHDPALIELSEREGWDIDYYMTSLYYLTRPREETAKLLPQIPLGEIYLPGDRERMLGVIRSAKKPCLAYKVLAAGRADLSEGGIRRAFGETLSGIKAGDGMIVGMFQEFGDQVAMNARIVREIAGGARPIPGAAPEARG